MATDACTAGEETPEDSINRAADLLASEVDDEGTIEIFELFLRDAAARVGDIQQAYEAQEAAELRRAAHSFASVCRTVGAHEYARISENLENSALAGDLSSATAEISQICKMLPPVLRLVEQAVARLRARGGENLPG